MTLRERTSELEERTEFKKQHTYRGLIFRDMKKHPVHVRASRGKGIAYFEFEDNRSLDAHIDEIPPNGRSGNHRHTNEAVISSFKGKVILSSRKKIARKFGSIGKRGIFFLRRSMPGISISTPTRSGQPGSSP